MFFERTRSLINFLATIYAVFAIHHENICGHLNNRRIYLELGETGYLTTDHTNNEDLTNNKNQTIHNECNLEIITCPSCVINVKFALLNISRNCEKTSVLDSCGCDYVWLYEPKFEASSGEQFCGYFVENITSNLYYKSQTRSVIISFIFTNLQEHAFLLQYVSERNKHVIDGYPKLNKLNNGNQQITSPYFPNTYPRDLSVEYVINCKSTNNNCKIRLIFTDFQIATTSLIEFFDWNGQRMDIATGVLFRPPVIMTTGPSLTLRFYANGGTNLGFKALYHYFIGDIETDNVKPNINCGGYVSNLGGVITMMKMLTEGTKLYDCIWILRPPDNYFHQKTHLFLKVAQFTNLAGNAELLIHQGLTSNEPVVEVLKHPISHFFRSRHNEHVVTATQGFYISLRGLFRPESSLALIYSAFSYKDCYSETDFLCRNHRCISTYLTCDSFDHCGDNSDELPKCVKDRRDSRWLLSPNFYFPNIYKNTDLKFTTVVFVVCSLGLISLIIALIFILYRLNVKNRSRSNIQSHLQAINDLLGDNQVTEEIISITDDPPNYEAPPDYSDVIQHTNCPKKPLISSHHSKNNYHQNRNDNDETLASTSRSCQTTPQPIVMIPDSPPPTYVSLNLNIQNDEDQIETTMKSTEESYREIFLLNNFLRINSKLYRSYVKPKKNAITYEEHRRLSDTQLYVKQNSCDALTISDDYDKGRLHRSISFDNLNEVNNNSK